MVREQDFKLLNTFRLPSFGIIVFTSKTDQRAGGAIGCTSTKLACQTHVHENVAVTSTEVRYRSFLLALGSSQDSHRSLCRRFSLSFDAIQSNELVKALEDSMTNDNKGAGMRPIAAAFAFILFPAIPALAQTQPASSDDKVTRSDDRPHHEFGWIGLIGLAGLAGLRRAKSEDERRLEATGVNVKSVKV
jgi:MYXO-CTERM domain-containing protein